MIDLKAFEGRVKALLSRYKGKLTDDGETVSLEAVNSLSWVGYKIGEASCDEMTPDQWRKRSKAVRCVVSVSPRTLWDGTKALSFDFEEDTCHIIGGACFPVTEDEDESKAFDEVKRMVESYNFARVGEPEEAPSDPEPMGYEQISFI